MTKPPLGRKALGILTGHIDDYISLYELPVGIFLGFGVMLNSILGVELAMVCIKPSSLTMVVKIIKERYSNKLFIEAI